MRNIEQRIEGLSSNVRPTPMRAVDSEGSVAFLPIENEHTPSFFSLENGDLKVLCGFYSEHSRSVGFMSGPKMKESRKGSLITQSDGTIIPICDGEGEIHNYEGFDIRHRYEKRDTGELVITEIREGGERYERTVF